MISEIIKKYKSGSAIEILQEAILSGDLQAGMNITQNELAESLNVSRMPVREALIALEHQGLVERMTNQHVRIINPDDEAIRTLFHDMAALESDSVKNFHYELLGELLACDEQKTFHRMIYENTKAPFRKKILESMTEIYFAFVMKYAINQERINQAFESLRKNFDSGFDSYCEILAEELINIRRSKNQCSTSDQ